MIKNKSLSIALVVAALCAAGSASAQSTGDLNPRYQIGGAKPIDDAPKGIALGEGVGFFPTLKLGYGRDDNMFLSNTNKTNSDYALLEAGGAFMVRQKNRQFILGFDSKSANYFDSSADNYRDYTTRGVADLAFYSNSGLQLGAGYTRGHDPRGSTDRGIAQRPDVFRDAGVDALYAFGGNDARGRFELAANRYDKRYRNNRATTAAADRETNRLRGTFFVRMMPKTNFLVEVQQAELDYVQAGSTLDSKETKTFIGVAWEATAATSGTIKLGRQKKDFDFSGRTNSSTSGWEVGIEWKPLTYTKVDFFTTKSFGESTGLGDLILNKRAGSVWTHNWTSRIVTEATYTFAKDDFVGAGVSRKDETDTFGIKLTYKLGRMLELGADFTRSDRDSNLSQFTYKRNQVMISVGAKL